MEIFETGRESAVVSLLVASPPMFQIRYINGIREKLLGFGTWT